MIITETRTISPDELNKIQNGIEQCLLLHLTLNETKNTLQVKAGVIPEFTEFAWKKLEEANPEFFKAYHFRLLLKDQVEKFNRLLDRQAELMVQLGNTPAIHMPQSSSNMGLVQTVNPGNMVLMQGMNGQTMQFGSTGLVQAMNGGDIRNTGSGHINGSLFLFGPPNGDVFDAPHAAVEMPVSSYRSVESQSQPINNTLLGVNASFVNMGLNPSGFRQPNSTANFSINSDILESYSGFPFIASGSNSLNPQDRVEQQDNPSSFNQPDSTANFSLNSDILHIYSGSPFIASGSNSLNPQDRVVQQDNPSSFSQADSTANFSLNSDILKIYSGSSFIASGSNSLNPQDRVEQQDIRRLDTNGGLSDSDFEMTKKELMVL